MEMRRARKDLDREEALAEEGQSAEKSLWDADRT